MRDDWGKFKSTGRNPYGRDDSTPYQPPRIQAKKNYTIIQDKAFAKHGQAGVREAVRQLALHDLFYMLVFILGRPDADNDWVFDRCREVQAEPDGCLDLWARESYKSTIITYALTIQDILNDPEITVGIFSHTKPIAKAFLRQIKYEFETNERLKQLFRDVLYSDPKKQSPVWSEDKGIVVKRQNNPKECTVEASGLVDGQPTSRHYSLLIYDDVVTLDSVTTPEMIAKTTDAWRLSLNLGARGGKRRLIGTRYHANDTWGTIIKQGSAKVRLYPATKDGTPDGESVFLSRRELKQKRRDMGNAVFACQMLQNPNADSVAGFNKADFQFYISPPDPEKLNIAILVDPANSKTKKSDWSAFAVIGMGQDRNYYLLDMVRDRLNLTERANTLFRLHQEWEPDKVGYEQYGLQADIEYIKELQEDRQYRFQIFPLGGRLSKVDRISKLMPIIESHRWWMPRAIWYRNYAHEKVNLVDVVFSEEIIDFPVASHDDMLDSWARILDPKLAMMFPKREKTRKVTWRDNLKKHIRGSRPKGAMVA